jgi:membrane fusion protein (multidrug efflux system)
MAVVATSPIPVAVTSAPVAKRSRAPFVMGALVLVAGGVATAIYFKRLGKENTDDAQVEAHVASVAPRINGQVKKVDVNDNEVVKVGQVLVELDDRDQQVRLKIAHADLDAATASLNAAQKQLALTDKTAKANLVAAQGGVTMAAATSGSTNAMIDQAKADIVAAQSRVQLAKTERKRAETLHASGAMPQSEVDAKVAADETAAAMLSEANARLASAMANRGNSSGTVESAHGRLLAASTVQEQIDTAQAQVGIAEAKVAQAQATVDRAQLDLDYTKVTAEIAGSIAKRNVEPGQLVGPERPLMAIVDLQDTWIVANMKETQLKDIKPGQPADIEIDSFDGTLAGHVDSLAAGTGSRFALLPAENASGNFTKVTQRIPVKIVLDHRDDARLLRPGMSAEVTIHTK